MKDAKVTKLYFILLLFNPNPCSGPGFKYNYALKYYLLLFLFFFKDVVKIMHLDYFPF